MVLFTFIGVAGLLCLLLAFFLAESGKVKTSLRAYTLLNATGSFFLIIYSIHISAWVFTVLNIVWFVVAILNVIRLKQGSHPFQQAAGGHRRQHGKRRR